MKKHIEIHHERKHHYPCKECVFVGQSVDDYAEHYHTFHKVSAFVNYDLVSRHHRVFFYIRYLLAWLFVSYLQC